MRAGYARQRPQRASALPGELEVLFSIDSTNDYLYTAQAIRAGHPRIVFAEIQLAGRGRRGRSWLAPFGSGLTFSIGWTYPELPADLSALSLAMGVQVADALRDAGAAETMLKWPNDIVWRHRKLGGLLIQLKLEAGGAASVVVGLGLNVALPADARERLATSGAAPVADLREASAAIRRVAMRWPVALAVAICDGLDRVRARGLRAVRGSFRRARLAGRCAVRVSQAAGSVEGRALGADRDGALRVDVGGRIERFHCRRRDAAPGSRCARMMLLVDIGNSRVKWASVRSRPAGSAERGGLLRLDDGRLATRAVRRRPASTACSWRASPARRAPRCSPRRHDSRPASPLHSSPRAREAAGVRNAYPEPRLLGVDRWLAAIAAYRLARGACCVADIGTAATLDGVAGDGQHLGGFIVPGPELMMRSLWRGTSDLASHTATSGAAAGALVRRQHARRHRARLPPGGGGHGRSCRGGDDAPPRIGAGARC